MHFTKVSAFLWSLLGTDSHFGCSDSFQSCNHGSNIRSWQCCPYHSWALIANSCKSACKRHQNPQTGFREISGCFRWALSLWKAAGMETRRTLSDFLYLVLEIKRETISNHEAPKLSPVLYQTVQPGIAGSRDSLLYIHWVNTSRDLLFQT